MSIISVAIRQLQNTIDKNSIQARKLFQPRDNSWIQMMRQALRMSGAQLARKMNVSRGLISNVERAELDGKVTLKKMRDYADAMDCDFVYCFAPRDKIENILKRRAIEKAQTIVDRTNKHMGLEGQALDNARTKFELDRLAAQLLEDDLSELWNDIVWKDKE